ncbi:MAG: SpoIID/LytB domain-containing protein [Actinomycetota bacterium]|nr:SpoIID/LytB domain-containing protein [Actinomycetota bacterium]
MVASSSAGRLVGLIAVVLAGALASSPGVRAADLPSNFALVGSGWGHGVGMSQWGAYGMAKEGRDAASIVSHYFANTEVLATPDDMDIRVGVLIQVPSAQVRSEVLEAGGGAIEITVGASVVVGGPADVFSFTPGAGSVSVQRTADGVVTDLGSAPSATVRWAGTRTPGTAAGPATLLNLTGPKGRFHTPGHRYRYGYFEMVPVATAAGPRLNVVNSVRVHEEYLYGISEVSNSWPAAAMQAQVIAARSYALAKVKRGMRKACACHLDDGDGPYSDQFFTGWAKPSSALGNLWVDAVNATHASETTGMAVIYAGVPVSTFYTSSTGGMTQASKDAWGGALPFAVSVDDHWSLIPQNVNSSWTVNVPQARMALVFRLPDVGALSITERYVSGAVKKIRATATDGTVNEISGTALLKRLKLKSSYVLSVNGDAGVPVAVAATSAPATMTVSMNIGPTMTPKEGASLKFRGQVAPATAGIQVDRQMLVDGVWKTVATKTTKANGSYSFKVKKSVPAGAIYNYRVVVSQNGAVVAQSAESVVTVLPKK